MSNLRTRVVAWIHKVPLWVWLFLVVTQAGHAYKSSRDMLVTQQILDKRVSLKPSLPPDFVESAQSWVDDATSEFWWTIISLAVVFVCAAIRYFGPPAAGGEDIARTDVNISARGSRNA
jgi:hypothetical protein